jgi:hypothetical protein
MNADQEPRRVVLSVPGLAAPPAGGGCCAVSRDDVLLEELDSWPGLLALDVDPERETAVVLITPGCEHLPEALEALADRGLAATVVQTERLSQAHGNRPSPLSVRAQQRRTDPNRAEENLVTTTEQAPQHATCACGCCGPATDSKAAAEADKANDRSVCRCSCGCASAGGCRCDCTTANCSCGCA